MTTTLVQLHCASLRSKSAYAAFGDFHEEHADLMGATIFGADSWPDYAESGS